ncbi:MAG: hypothetical protein Q4D94_04985 [Bacillota bacterium]|nr:hypothetical protein [Bacillota bacterium]
MEQNMTDIDMVVSQLDAMVSGEISRMKIETSKEIAQGEMKKAYHHGRCDVGSPFATGKLYDLEDMRECN